MGGWDCIGKYIHATYVCVYKTIVKVQVKTIVKVPTHTIYGCF